MPWLKKGTAIPLGTSGDPLYEAVMELKDSMQWTGPLGPKEGEELNNTCCSSHLMSVLNAVWSRT
jgi:hypothetical protein